jgi:hypothetical protein
MKRSTFKEESGTALVVALVLAMLMSGMAVAIVSLSVTEKGITLNDRVAKQALYTADSGVEVAKQQMTDFSHARMESLIGMWSGSGPIIDTPLDFFPDEGLTYQSDDLGFDVHTTFEFADSSLVSTSQTFNYYYVSVAKGTSFLSGESNIISQGTLRLSASRGSFADYLIFTDVHYTPSGDQIWFHTTGYFDGRVHSNGKLRFAYFPTFEDLVTCHPQTASYYNNGHPKDLDADRNGDRDVPNFYGGFERGVDEIPLPENSFSQERAALGYAATDTTELSLAQRKTALGMDPLDVSPIPQDIYIPNDTTSVTGGIYIVGDLDKLRLSIDEDGFQNYLMTHDNGTTKKVILDKKNNRTKVYSGGDSTFYAGLPRGMIYGTGRMYDVGGEARVDGAPVPAIEEDTQVTVTAEDDILVESDIVYEDIENSDGILGLYSSGGDVRISTSAPDELMIDAFVFAAGDHGAFKVDDYDRGDYRGQVHLRGGAVQRYYGAFGTFNSYGANTGYGRHFSYDRRGLEPPYYPLTCVFKIDRPIPHISVWREV